MAIKYKVVKQVFGYDKTNTPKYVVRSVTGEMLTFDKVRTQVSQICGIHRGITSVVLDGLLDVLVNNLDMGHSVQLGEFGTLRPGLRSKAQTSEETANSDTVYCRKVNFLPGKMLKNFLKNVAVTRVSPLDVDYTDGSSLSGGTTGGSTGGSSDGSDGGGDDAGIDPNA